MSLSNGDFDPKTLIQVARMRMPFGRYQGTILIDLPEPYLVWFEMRGYPRGSLGDLMRLALEINSNGLRHLVEPLRDLAVPPSSRDEDARGGGEAGH